MVVDCLKRTIDRKTVVKVLEDVMKLHEKWVCPLCDMSKYSDMIECDQCGVWFHWGCVSAGGDDLPVPEPSPWICGECVNQSKLAFAHYSQTGKRPRNRGVADDE